MNVKIKVLESQKEMFLHQLDTLDELNEEIDIDEDLIQFPQMPMRLKNLRIHPQIQVALAVMKYKFKLAHAVCVPLLVAIGNILFQQDWKLGNSVYKSTKGRDILPGLTDGHKKVTQTD